MLGHDWLGSCDTPRRIVLGSHRVLILLVRWGWDVGKRILMMMVCLNGNLGMRSWKAVEVIYIAVREERITR